MKQRNFFKIGFANSITVKFKQSTRRLNRRHARCLHKFHNLQIKENNKRKKKKFHNQVEVRRNEPIFEKVIERQGTPMKGRRKLSETRKNKEEQKENLSLKETRERRRVLGRFSMLLILFTLSYQFLLIIINHSNSFQIIIIIIIKKNQCSLILLLLLL